MKNNSPPLQLVDLQCVCVLMFFSCHGPLQRRGRAPVIANNPSSGDLMAVHAEKVATLLIDKGCKGGLPEGIKPLPITSGD